MRLQERLRTPQGVMTVVIAMYAVKVVLKLVAGFALDVPAVTGDGLHNVVDIFEAASVMVVLWLASRSDEHYPNGRGNYESLAVFLEGGFLVVVALGVGWESLVGVYAWYQGTQPAAHPYESYLWIAALYVFSAILSVVVSRYQIRVGRAHNRPLVVADGKETMSDAYVEFGVLAGAVGMVVDQNIVWGHVAGLVVMVKLLLTGRELVVHGLQALLQRTIGLEHEQAIRAMFTETPGVRGVEQCRTWRVGGVVKVVVKVSLDARTTEAAARDLKWAVGGRIAAYLREQDMPDSELFIRFDAGLPDDARVAYLVRYVDGVAQVATGGDATHLWLCDVQHGRVTRIVEEAVARSELPSMLATKQVHTVFGWLSPTEEYHTFPCGYEAAIVPFPPDRVN